MEDSRDARDTCMGCQLRTELSLQQPGEAWKRPSQYYTALLQCGLHDVRFRLAEQRGQIAGLRWHGWDVAFFQFRRDIEEHHLPLDLFPDERRDQAKLLNSFDFDSCAALDGDIDILANRPDPSLHLPRRPEQGSEREGDLPRLFRGLNAWCRCDFYERDAEPVESVDDLGPRFPELARGVFLEEDRGHTDSLSIDLEAPLEGHEPGPLEPRCVRSVDHDLAHEVHFVDRVRIQQKG